MTSSDQDTAGGGVGRLCLFIAFVWGVIGLGVVFNYVDKNPNPYYHQRSECVAIPR